MFGYPHRNVEKCQIKTIFTKFCTGGDLEPIFRGERLMKAILAICCTVLTSEVMFNCL